LILLLVFVVVVVLWFILSWLQVVVFIPVSLGGMIQFTFGVIVVLYLVLVSFIIRS